MATTRPFAYNTGSTIDGTIQIGNIAIGVSDQDYSQNPGGVKWWMGPDEELGYVIANQVPTGDHPTPTDEDSYINFWRSTDLTEQSLLDLLNVLPITDGLEPFTNGSDAKTWLNANGYFTSYGEDLPTPTPTPTNLPTATPTPTPEGTPVPTDTPTPTPLAATSTPTPTDTPVPATSTPIPTDTPTPTPDATNVPTDTPTPEPTSGPTATPTSTPEGAVLTIIVPEGTPGIIFDGETYTSNVSAGVVKNQQYFINVTEPSSNFSRWSGTGVNLPAATSKFTVVYVTGNTATLEILLTLPTATPTPTSAPTSTPLPATPTPTLLPATATPTPTTTNTPTPTITVGPLDFTITFDCSGGGRIITSNHVGGSGVIDRSTGLFNTEQDALAETSWFQLSNPVNNVITIITPQYSSGTRWVSIRDRNNPTDVFAKSITFDCASTPTPTPLPATATPTPTVGATSTPIPATDTPTPTPEPTSGPTDTPTPTPVGSCSGKPYVLSNLMTTPSSGESLWISSTMPASALNLVNILGTDSSVLYFNEIDNDGTDQTTYFGNAVGTSFTVTLCQNGNSAIYSGTNIAMVYDGSNSSYFLDSTKLSLVQSSPVSTFTFGEVFYIGILVSGQSTPTPTPTVASTNVPTDTPTPTPEATSTPEPATATPAPTGVPTDTPTPTPEATNVPTDTPTPTPTFGSGYSFNLVILPYNFPTTGNTIMNQGAIQTGTTNPNELAISGRGIYWNSIDSDGIDRTSYFSQYTGQSVTITMTQGSSTVIYSGDTNSLKYWDQSPSTGFVFGTDIGLPPTPTPNGVATLIQSGTTWTVGQPVYISVTINGSTTSTPTPLPATSTPTPTPTTGASTATPTPTIAPTDTPTPTPDATSTPTPTVASTSTPTPLPATSTPSPTDTPTPTPTSVSSPMTVTITEVGSNVVMSASGTVDLTGLTLVESNFGPIGGGGLGINNATFICGNNGLYASTYSGFTTTPSNFGSGSGAPPSSASGDYFGVVINQQPPYLLLVPTGYTSGTNISSTQTFNNTTLSTLGLSVGTYTYTWSGGSIDVVVGTGLGGPTPTPTPTSTGGGAGWNFYETSGTVIQNPPQSDGQILMYTNAGGPPTSTYSPNNGTAQYILIYKKDSAGTDYTTQFTNLQTNGGTINITQNGNTATYVGGSGVFYLDPGGFLIIPTAVQTVTVANPFTYGDTITLSFS
jgi:hypothetical protein